MALIDKASLLMVPSTYEAGTLYNVLPSGNRAPDETDQNSGYDQTRADFTFDRGSNAAATRVNSDGLIEKYRENLSLYSNTFSSWNAASGGSVTSGQSGYDGTNNAWLLTSGAFTYSRVERTISYTGVYTISVYAKAGTLDWLSFENSGISSDETYFDLVNGTTGTDGSNVIQSNIESVGDGWYRCSATFNGTSNVQRIYPAVGNGDLNSAQGNIYIQNFQLETGLVATDYLDSGATTAKAGVLIDLPRINYDANGENGALLLEPSRQQLITQSEYFGSYTPVSATITDNAATSPEGLVNAASFIETTASGRHRTQTNSFSVTSGNTYTLSIFAKIASGSRLLCLNADYIFNARAYFDLVNGDVEGTDSGSASIEDYGNGWYRCSITGTSSITGSSLAYFGLEDGASDNGYTGDGTSGHYWYGAQVEAGSYATSYIPNHGTSGGVTRAADSITSGTITAPLSGGYTAFIELETLSTSVYNQIQFRETSANYVLRIGNQINVGAGSTIQTNTTGMNKFALQVSSGGAYELFKNGSSVATGTGITHDIELIKTDLAGQGVKQIAVFNEALTDAECITLTTL